MPYSQQHKRRTRLKILQAAQRLFTTQGFEATSIEDVMLECGLTRGGFYAHFRSKGDLYQQAVGTSGHGVPRSVMGRGDIDPWLDTLFRSAGQADSEWAFLASDVASQQPEVRAAYAEALKRLNERLGRELGGDASFAATAMVVGSLAIAASVDDPALISRVTEACLQQTTQQNNSDDAWPVFWSYDREPESARRAAAATSAKASRRRARGSRAQSGRSARSRIAWQPR